jgi:hypothetical protein
LNVINVDAPGMNFAVFAVDAESNYVAG